jgi:hypothetical protein
MRRSVFGRYKRGTRAAGSLRREPCNMRSGAGKKRVSPLYSQSRRGAAAALDIYVGVKERLRSLQRRLTAFSKEPSWTSVRRLGWRTTLSLAATKFSGRRFADTSVLHSAAATKICLRRAVWMRRWVLKFGPLLDRELRRQHPRPTSRWHLDEMAVRASKWSRPGCCPLGLR